VESFDVTPFVDGRCKTPIEELQAAVDGAVSAEQAVKLRQCLNHIDELEKHKSEIEREIFRLSEKYEAALNLIRTVPGFDKNPLTAIQVLSEIGGDMSVFPTAKHLVSWAGCCHRNDQSNKKIKSTRISRAGSYFKQVLVQVANALIKSKKHPEFTNRYKRIKARRGHKKAIIAICRMILTAIWHILTDLKPYTVEGYSEPRPVKEGKVLSTSQALNLLKQRGYIIKDESPITS
jgi:transposase